MKRSKALAILSLLVCAACSGPAIRPQSPDAEDDFETQSTLISGLTRPHGMSYLRIERASMVNGLDGTGSDPAPSSHRAEIMTELQRHKIANPSEVLASPHTALVVVEGYLPPGIQKGERFDVSVLAPRGSQTASLQGGWLLESRLTETALLGNQVRTGHTLALAEGPVLVDPSAQGDENRIHLTRGRVLSGGVAIKSRNLGLMVHSEHRSVRASQQIGVAINRRFNTFIHGVKTGVATPKTDEFVELIVHPRYKDNVGRYMRVVRSIAFRETESQLQNRLALLERQLLDPVTSASAAVRLEAIGKDAVEALSKGIKAQDPEVRFYSAEALAYLDETAAAEPLGKTAENEPAFRAYALAALSAMDDVVARDELRRLLDVSSAETRYGAFRSLWAMNASDPAIAGENLGGEFSYHVLDSPGPAMVHVTRSKRPEIVLFGREQHLKTPVTLEAGKYILVNGQTPGQITVSRFAPGQPDQKRVVSTQLDDVIRAIVELEGRYPDVVQALQEAKDHGALSSRLKVDALPETGRSYQRDPADSDQDEAVNEVSGPLPDLFAPWRMLGNRGRKQAKKAEKDAEKKAENPAQQDQSEPQATDRI
jgi:hypothetical protein